jgi:hypothetical protein
MEMTIDLNRVTLEYRSNDLLRKHCDSTMRFLLRYGNKSTFLDSRTSEGVLEAIKRLACDVQNPGRDPS